MEMADGEDAPLPEDMSSEDLIREVYARFGRAIESAQDLEFTLVNTILLAAPGTHDTYEAIEEAMLELLRNTMRGLIGRVRGSGIDVNLHEDLTRALRLRNFLVHDYFRQRVFVFQRRYGQLGMIAELDQAASIFEGIRERLKTLATEGFSLNRSEIEKLTRRLTGETVPGLFLSERSTIVVTEDGYLVGKGSVVRAQSARQRGETTYPGGAIVIHIEWEKATEDQKARLLELAERLDMNDLLGDQRPVSS